MDIATYSRSQDAAWRPVRRLIRALLHLLGVPVTDPQRQDFAVRLYRPLVDARDLNFLITRNYLAAAAPEIAIPVPRDYPFSALTNTLEKAVTPLRVAGDPIVEDNRADITVMETARKAIEAPVFRQVKEPARETIAAIGEDEKTSYGWARVLKGAESCAWCAMLASREPTYSSRGAALYKGANGLEAYHGPYPNKNGKLVGGVCDCEAVLVYKGSTNWEGRKAQQGLSDLWRKTTKGLSYKDNESFNAFRREWDKLVRDGETVGYLPESIQAPSRTA
jgi:hypothetical protein